jgi:superfamily I DNA/RNA helicase
VLPLVPEERFDAVIVDEGQDFRPAWWTVVQRLLRDPARGHLWVFWDPHQNIFTGEANLAERLGLPNYQLSANCRNSRPIANFARIVHEPAFVMPAICSAHRVTQTGKTRARLGVPSTNGVGPTPCFS